MKTTARRVFFLGFRWSLTISLSLIILVPIAWIFLSSITKQAQFLTSPIKYIPREPTIENYIYLLKHVSFARKLYSTAIVITFTLIVSTLVCVMAGYAFARFRSKGLSFAFVFVMFPFFIPAVVRIRPLYELWRFMGLFDTYLGIVLLYTSAIAPMTVAIVRNFVLDIPVSIEEAGKIDGAGFLQTILYLVMPLLRPAIATILIINFIICLNDFFTPFFFSNNIQVLTLAIVQLPTVNQHFTVPWDLTSAMGVIILAPIILFVGLFQKQIMTGIMAGGVKQ
ncbi:MAG: carbohydrate ABC transporter permease [Deltaproteobacteria bacterium]|nr:carbohydrate ABC transporter permease [Deltaproteobacteria bacterium]